jgi:hypothetical protein
MSVIRLMDIPSFRERRLDAEISDILGNANAVNEAADKVINETLQMLRRYEGKDNIQYSAQQNT